MKIAIVKWADVQISRDSHYQGWLTEDEFKDWCNEGVIICKSVGFITYEADEFIVISQTIFENDTSESAKIPRSSIVDLCLLEGDAVKNV